MVHTFRYVHYPTLPVDGIIISARITQETGKNLENISEWDGWVFDSIADFADTLLYKI